MVRYIGYRCYPLKALLGICCVAHAVGGSVENDYSKGLVLDAPDSDTRDDALFVPLPKTNLRVPKAEDFVQVDKHVETAAKNNQELAKLPTLTKKDQIELMESFKEGMISLVEEIDSVDLSQYEDFRPIAKMGKANAKQAIQSAGEAISFFRSIMEETESHEVMDTIDDGDGGGLEQEQEETAGLAEGSVYDESIQQSNANTTLHVSDDEALEMAGVEADIKLLEGEQQRMRRLYTEEDRDSSNNHQRSSHRQEEDEDPTKRRRREQKKAKDKFSHMFHHPRFSNHASRNHVRNWQSMHEAMVNGDVQSAFSSFMSPREHISHKHYHRMRRLRQSKGQFWLEQQCQLLTECALGLSLYDTFIFFYSDDIDPTTGETDDNIFQFDERKIMNKYEEIQKAAKLIKDDGHSQPRCSHLLQLFFRTVERGDIPEWEGATVNQVCLAEGSTKFVKYQQMVNALVDNSFRDGYNSETEAKWLADVHDVEKTVEMVAFEAFNCSEDLFFYGDRVDRVEHFPYGGCGEVSLNCSLEDYIFPVRLNTETTSRAGVEQYEELTNKTQCAVYFAIEDANECKLAGLALGGEGEDAIVGIDEDAPCGCYLEEGTLRWDNKTSNCKNPFNLSNVVCRKPSSLESYNDQGYEPVQHVTECPDGYAIDSVEECAAAGLSVWGFLKDYKVMERDWEHTPCGCFMDLTGRIFFDPGVENCANRGFDYQSICKRNTESRFVSLRRKFRCDPGSELSDEEECRQAVIALGGNLMNGQVVIDNGPLTPCGCFFDHKTQLGKFKDDTETCRNLDWQYDSICRNSADAYRYKRVQNVDVCAAGEVVTSRAECTVAGEAVGGIQQKMGVSEGITSGSLYGYPCGCYLEDGVIFFNFGEFGCRNDYNVENVCRDNGVTGAARDERGQLISNDLAAFISKDYATINAEANDCFAEETAEMEEDCLEESGIQSRDMAGEDFWKCRVDKQKEAIETCDRFGPIQTAIELVYGANTSPGFICGIKDAVNQGARMPGSCCLDAPFELEGVGWGQRYDCEAGIPCKNPGPYLAGVNADACSAHGGTWCPTPADCSVLKQCIEELTKDAELEERIAFVQYLSGAPEIEEPTDLYQCGSARKYFGFDELFINDYQICEDVEQLKFARDFDFLNEFFDQGSSGGGGGSGGDGGNGDGGDGGGGGGNPIEVPYLELKPPVRSKSTSPPVLNEKQMQAINYAVTLAAKLAGDASDALEKTKCPVGGCFGSEIAGIICRALKTALGLILLFIAQYAEGIVQVSLYLYEAFSYNQDAAEAEEEVHVIFENMQSTATYLGERFEQVLTGSRRSLQQGILESGKTAGVAAADQVEQCLGDFMVKVKVLNSKVSHQKSVVLMSTINGALVGSTFSFWRLDQDQGVKVAVSFQKAELETGNFIIRFGEDAADSEFLFLQASPITNPERISNDIISFG